MCSTTSVPTTRTVPCEEVWSDSRGYPAAPHPARRDDMSASITTCRHRLPRRAVEPLLTSLVPLYNLIPYQRRARHAGQCGVEVEDGPRFAARHRSVADCTSGFWLYPSGCGAGCVGMTASTLGTLVRA